VPAHTPAPRRRLTLEQRRAEILDAALKVFSERGFHDTSIDEIAHAAGISKALVHEHFESKRELHLSLIDFYAQRLFERIATAAAPGPPAPARLEAGLEAFLKFAEDDRGAWRLLFREAVDAEAAAVLDRMVAQITGLVATLIAEDPSAMTLEEEPDFELTVEVIAQLVVGATQGAANWWAEHPSVPREQIVQIAMDFSWLGLSRLRGRRRRDARASEDE
jgi:AcrR family transcriptional regulator